MCKYVAYVDILGLGDFRIMRTIVVIRDVPAPFHNRDCVIPINCVLVVYFLVKHLSTVATFIITGP